MAKIIHKKSSIPSKVPTTSDLEYGELALNYKDGKLYFKSATNSILSFDSDTSAFVTLNGTQTLTNKTLTSPTITDGTLDNVIIGGTTPTTITGTEISATGNLKSLNSVGDEGGEILLAKPQTNTSISGTGVTIDVYQNKLRIFEQGGTSRGVYIDLTTAGNGVSTNLLGGGVAGVTSVGGYTGDVTATQLLTSIKTVDGTGSGLDADLLDGQSGAYYLDWTNTTNKPTTLAGYGITDAATSTHNHDGTYQPVDADLTAIAALVGTSGFLKKTAADTWSLDTSTYLTGNQSISVTGDATGSGTTSIALTLANSGVTAGSYGSSTAIPVISVDAKGRITSASTSSITVGDGALTLATSGVGLSGSASFTANQSTGATFTVTSNATSANTASTIVARDASGNFTAGTITATLSGNAATVTNGVYTTGSYADPAWITSINYSKLTGTIPTWNQNTTGSAAKWTTARTLSFTGDATGSGSVDGSANVATALTLANSGVTAGTYTKITVDAKGRATSGTTLSATDIPNLDAAKITSGVLDAARLPSYVDDVLEYANLAGFPATGEAGKIYVALDTNKTYRWSGTVYVYITSGAVDSVAGKTGVVTLVKGDVGLGNVDNTADSAKNVLSATKLTTARTISLTGDVTGSVSFDGSGNAAIATTIAADSVVLGTDTTGNYVASIANGSYITGGNGGSEGAAITLAVDATSANTASKVVARDASGNFSAGTITAALSGNASTATTLQTARTINGTSFNGSANITITANTPNTLTLGTGLTGTSFNGSAAVTAAVSYGTTAGTACQGNDSRLSDARVASGGNSDTVDSLHASSFLRSDAATTYSGGLLTVTTPAGSLGSNTGAINTLQIYQATLNTDAFQTFHIANDYAVHFGLDGTTNDLFVGGWSAGAVKNKIWHAGNDGTGSGLDADLLDGLHVHTGTNNEANKVVRTDGNGYIQAGYIHSAAGNEGNNSSPARIWGTNGSDSYQRTYLTRSLTSGYSYNYTQGFNTNWNTDFAAAPAGSTILRGDTSTGSATGGPGGTWWFQQNMRHTNSSNVWGVQVAWGWEDNANILRTRNVQNGTYGGWVTYLNSNNYSSYASPLAGSSSLTTTGTVTSGTWSGSFGAVSGANLTSLNASNLASGTVPTARLGTGTANSTTYLRGDNTWASVSGFSTTDDTKTNASYYPVIATTAGGSTAKTSSTKLYFNPSTGTLNATTFNSLSDAKQKHNVVNIENATNIINQINGVEFDWKDNNQHSAGVIAQQLETVLPWLVSTTEEGIKSVNYSGMIGYLIQAVKELSAEVDQLKNK